MGQEKIKNATSEQITQNEKINELTTKISNLESQIKDYESVYPEIDKMDSQQKITLFWKIFKLINTKFHKNKIVINKILLSKRKIPIKCDARCSPTLASYFHNAKTIIIYEKVSLLYMIRILSHELAHAYQYQIRTKYYKTKIANLKKKGKLTFNKEQKLIHDELFREYDDKYLGEIDKNISVIKIWGVL